MRTQTVSSRYWFTINSNVHASDQSKEAVKAKADFLDGLRRIFLSKNILNFIKIIDEEDLEDKIPKEKLISKIDSQVTLEIGGEKDCYHAHVLITIYHRTTIILVTNWIRDYYNLKYNRSFFVSPGKIRPDPAISFVRYTEKSMKRLPRLIFQAVLTGEDGETETFFEQMK